MTIHVVRSGDTLWLISRRYGVSVQSIVDINELQDIPSLVVGQALVIPGTETAYAVRPGDTLWSIGRKFNISPARLAEVNGITNPELIYPGMVLRIPALSKNYGYIEVNAFIEPSTPENEARIMNDVGPLLTYISPFSYQVNPDGSLNPIKDEVIIQNGRPYRDAPLLTITNFRNGNFDTALGHTILTSDTVQQNLINNLIATMRSKGYYGLLIDFERIAPADRELYNNFLRRVVAALRALNYPVGTALAPKLSATQVGEWYEAHDYPAHGQIVDFVVLMTYEWGWSGGPPLPVAPINQVRAVLNYAVSVIPRKKILMGMPLYGYNWPLPYRPGGRFAPRVSPQQAIALAAKYNASILYDETAQSPYFYYTDENGVAHVVWFEDARSARAKFLTEVEYGLRGVSYWELGSSFPQNWAILDDMFNIVKVIR